MRTDVQCMRRYMRIPIVDCLKRVLSRGSYDFIDVVGCYYIFFRFGRLLIIRRTAAPGTENFVMISAS